MVNVNIYEEVANIDHRKQIFNNFTKLKEFYLLPLDIAFVLRCLPLRQTAGKRRFFSW